jgi:uncharacterized protein YbbK (DUF523 family)
MIKVLVSSCLVGETVRYDGTAVWCEAQHLAAWQTEARLVRACPEVEAGCPVPRLPAEIEPGATGVEVLAGRARIRDRSGADVTRAFARGARLALERAREAGVRIAILKDRSPSCGSTCIHDGTFCGRIKPGRGVTAALLEQHGIRVFSENQIADAAACLRALESDAAVAPEA